jgi:hypothetical protein
MLLDGALPPRALLGLWTVAARVHPMTGKAWTTTNELAAVHGMHPENFSRHVAVLKQLGLLVRCKEKPAKKLAAWERRFLPDPSARGPHSGRLFMQLHPLLVSVGRASKRDKALDEFRLAVGDCVTPFEEALAAIEAEDRQAAAEQELLKLVAAHDAQQAKLSRLEGLRQQLEQGNAQKAA